MVTVQTLLIIIALVFFVAEEFNASGRSIGWWGAIILAAALLWSRVA